MRTLLIDNYDSFTFNLFQMIAEVNGEEPVVVRNDEIAWDALADWKVDNIVISPGPGRPDRPSDFGVCAAAIGGAEVPLLGVCLGHQGLAQVVGGQVVHAPEVMHGRLSRVHHDGSPLFAGIPQGFEVVRYHSLCVSEPLPPALERLAWTEDGVLMAVRHLERPAWGVQFHPESICTSYGDTLLRNFRDLTSKTPAPWRHRVLPPRTSALPRRSAGPPPSPDPAPRLIVRKLDRLHDAETAFVHLYGSDPHAFWLDSAKSPHPMGRFSFMGGSTGPHASQVYYDVAATEVTVVRQDDVEILRESIFDYLRRELERLSSVVSDVPFDLNCGFVGYLGYELKADCGGSLVHHSSLPDAMFMFADRMLAFDHEERVTYLVCFATPETEADGERWLTEVEVLLEAIATLPSGGATRPAPRRQALDFYLSRDHETYLDDFDRCLQNLVEGETYEICLTNKLKTDVVLEPLPLYRILRRVNPAPFAAFLRVDAFAVACSSPERFLRIQRDRWVETKPIKGTARRGTTPEEDAAIAEELRTSEKNRAENLMITDLLRNDLGLVCEIGSVHVPHLMEVESYETVHQLVSTIRGRLRDDLGAADCIRACFPGGSMTGAPKIRTMEIIDELESEARGVYSGAIGYIGLSGAADFNIVIRTIVMERDETSIGVGGAIVMQSDGEDEFQETMLKGEALRRAIAIAVGKERLDGAGPARQRHTTVAVPRPLRRSPSNRTAS